MLILVQLNGRERGKVLRFAEAKPEMIGRKVPRARLEDTRVSRMHAEVSEQNGLWLLRDVGSSNGTFVNGRRIQRMTQLEAGDRIQIGRLLLRVMDAAPVGTAADLPAQPSQSPEQPIPLTPAVDQPAITRMLDEDGDQIDLMAEDAARERAEQQRRQRIEAARQREAEKRQAAKAEEAAAEHAADPQAEQEPDQPTRAHESKADDAGTTPSADEPASEAPPDEAPAESPGEGTLHGQPGDSMAAEMYREIKPVSARAKDDLAADQIAPPPQPPEARQGEEPDQSHEPDKVGQSDRRSDSPDQADAGTIDPDEAMQPEEKEAILEPITLSSKFGEADELDERFVLELARPEDEPDADEAGIAAGGRTHPDEHAEHPAVEGRRPWRLIAGLAAAAAIVIAIGLTAALVGPWSWSPWDSTTQVALTNGEQPPPPTGPTPPPSPPTPDSPPTPPDSGQAGQVDAPPPAATTDSPPPASDPDTTRDEPSQPDLPPRRPPQQDDAEQAVLARAGLSPPAGAFTEAPSVLGDQVLTGRVQAEGNIRPPIPTEQSPGSAPESDADKTSPQTNKDQANQDQANPSEQLPTEADQTADQPIPTGTMSIPKVDPAQPRTTARTGEATTAANEVARLLAALEDPVAQIADTSNREPPPAANTPLTNGRANDALDKPAPPRKIVFLVDASGSLIDALPGVVDWVNQRLATLRPQDRFTIIFFRAGEALEVPPAGWKKPTPAQLRQTRLWMNPAEANISAYGRSDPLNALDDALAYQPEQIYLLSDNSLGRRSEQEPGEAFAEALINRLNDQKGSSIRFVQFYHEDPHGLMKRIARELNAHFLFIGQEQPNADPLDWLNEQAPSPLGSQP